MLTSLALLIGTGIALAAGVSGLYSLGIASVAAGILFCGGLVAIRALRRSSAVRAWTACAAVVFVLLLVGVAELLPAYHRRFALRGQVRRHLDEAPAVPVACYPRRWDSISFYLHRCDVRVFAAGERQTFIDELSRHERVLVFVKNRGYLRDFLKELPTTLAFVPAARQGSNVTSGFVIRRNAREPAAQARALARAAGSGD